MYFRGLFSNLSNPSPRSMRSATSLCATNHLDRISNYSSNMRRNSSTNSMTRYGNSRLSDNESEVSKGSRSSRHSRHSGCRHRKQSEDSGTESDSSRKRRHRRKHRHCNANNSQYKLIDSEPQWKDLQRKHEQMNQMNSQYDDTYSRVNIAQNAVVRHVSGYINSGMESDTETQRNSTLNRAKKKQRSRSKSPESNRRDRLALEVKKHIEYDLVDPSTFTENEKKDIKYTKVEYEIQI